MYSHHITDMADRVAEALGLDAEGRDRARDAIAGYWGDKIALVWTTKDVRDCKKDATDEEAVEALQAVLRNHDASQGVNWDTIVDACGGSYPSEDDLDDEGADEDTTVELLVNVVKFTDLGRNDDNIARVQEVVGFDASSVIEMDSSIDVLFDCGTFDEASQLAEKIRKLDFVNEATPYDTATGEG